MDEKELTFEEAMQELEQIVNKLESGEVSLEESIELFQLGMKLSQACSGKLDEVERKIEMLIEDEAGIVKKPFEPPAETTGETS